MTKPMRRQVVIELDGKEIAKTEKKAPVRSGRRGGAAETFEIEEKGVKLSGEPEETEDVEKAAPWVRNADLPAPVRKLPGAAQTTWRAVAVEALKGGTTLDKAEEVAWNTVRRLWKETPQGWVSKEDPLISLSRIPAHFLKMAIEEVTKGTFTSGDLGSGGTSTGSKKPGTKKPPKPKKGAPVVRKENEQIHLDTDMTKAATNIENRYTFAPIYAPNLKDAHDEFVDDVTLEKAVWGYVRRDDRTLYLQHSEQRAGEWVNIVTWPFSVDTEITLPTGEVKKVTFPKGTSFMGVVWDEHVWPLVKRGEIRGYSLGGRAQIVEVDEPEAE